MSASIYKSTQNQNIRPSGTLKWTYGRSKFSYAADPEPFIQIHPQTFMYFCLRYKHTYTRQRSLMTARYINLHFTLLTYLLTDVTSCAAFQFITSQLPPQRCSAVRNELHKGLTTGTFENTDCNLYC